MKLEDTKRQDSFACVGNCAVQVLPGGDLKYVHTFFDTPHFRGWILIPPSLECGPYTVTHFQ